MNTLSVYQWTILITNLFTLYTIYRFSNVFFTKRKNDRLFFVLSYSVYFALLSFVCLVIDIPICTLITNVLGMFLLTFNYIASLKERLISVAYMYAFMFAVELVVVAVTGIFHIDIYSKGDYNKSTALVICNIITYLLVRILENHKRIKWNETISNQLFAATLFIPISTIIIAILFVHNTNSNKNALLLLLSLLLGLNAFTFYLYDKLCEKYNEHYKARITEAERNYYYNQCKLMQRSTEDILRFRHDINNHFTVISNLIAKCDYNDAKVYIEQLIKSNDNTAVMFSQTGNIIIDSIINYKLSGIDTNDINISTDIVVPSKTNVEIMDLSTILNNLLDNAIRALDEMSGEKILKIIIKYSRHRIIIRITNTFENRLSLENGEYLTTKPDKNGHGVGIKNARAAAEKYNGILQIKTEDGVFITDVLLYDTAPNEQQ